MLLRTIKQQGENSPFTTPIKNHGESRVTRRRSSRLAKASEVMSPAPDESFETPQGRRSIALRPISGNIRSSGRQQTPKRAIRHANASPERRLRISNDIKGSPRLRQFTNDVEESENCDSSDEDEVFFGAVSKIEKEKAERLRKRRRRTMLDHADLNVDFSKIPPRRADYAARVIQSFFKASMFKIWFQRRHNAAVVVQAGYRGHLARQHVLAMHGAASVIQLWWRRIHPNESGPRSPPMLKTSHETMFAVPEDGASCTATDAVMDVSDVFHNNEKAQNSQQQQFNQGKQILGAPSDVQAKLERLRQLRAKRQQLEQTLRRGELATSSNGFQIRSASLKLTASSESIDCADTSSSAGTSSNLTFHLSRSHLPRRLQNGNAGRKDQTLDRVTKLNTERNSGTRGDLYSYLREINDSLKSSHGQMRRHTQTTKVNWNVKLTNSVPCNGNTRNRLIKRRSILKKREEESQTSA